MSTDNGDVFQNQTANIFMTEFRKYMFLVAIVIKKDPKKYKEEFKGQVIYRAPFPAPPYIDKFWSVFILYSKNYELFCKDIFGGFLDKPSFSTPQEEFDAYIYLMRMLKRKVDLLVPFWNAWPSYMKIEHYLHEKDQYWCLLSLVEKTNAIKFFWDKAVSIQTQRNPVTQTCFPLV